MLLQSTCMLHYAPTASLSGATQDYIVQNGQAITADARARACVRVPCPLVVVGVKRFTPGHRKRKEGIRIHSGRKSQTLAAQTTSPELLSCPHDPNRQRR